MSTRTEVLENAESESGLGSVPGVGPGIIKCDVVVYSGANLQYSGFGDFPRKKGADKMSSDSKLTVVFSVSTFALALELSTAINNACSSEVHLAKASVDLASLGTGFVHTG